MLWGTLGLGVYTLCLRLDEPPAAAADAANSTCAAEGASSGRVANTGGRKNCQHSALMFDLTITLLRIVDPRSLFQLLKGPESSGSKGLRSNDGCVGPCYDRGLGFSSSGVYRAHHEPEVLSGVGDL